jgi:SPP1 gp7 family putative phage head morphogenesis protein
MPLIPDWLNLPFQQAIAALRRKVPIPSQSWQDFSGEAQNYAFTIAGLTQAELLQELQDLVDEALNEGQSLEEFTERFQSTIAGRWTASDARARSILENNIRSVQRQGRYEQSNTPEVMNYRPYRIWRHRTSELGVPRPLHQALNGKVFRADHPFWQTATPPCGWGCRCTFFNLSERDLVRMSKTVEEPPDPNTIADPGWNYTPGTGTAQQRAEVLQNGLERLSPPLRDQVQSDLRGRGIIQ